MQGVALCRKEQHGDVAQCRAEWQGVALCRKERHGNVAQQSGKVLCVAEWQGVALCMEGITVRIVE